MRKIQHFVVTKFNLRIAGGFVTDKAGVETRSDEWLEHRFGLFEKYCLPSMSNQINKDFKWFVFFDAATPEKYRERMLVAKKACPQIEAMYIEGIDVKKHVLEHVEADTDILITTRLDNDDAFREDALKVIREGAESASSDVCVNFRFGYSYDGEHAEVFSQKYNPFSSLIEFKKPAGFNTIIGTAHGKIHRLAEVKQIKTGPYWLMVVHERNVANRMPGEYRHYSIWKWRRLRRYIKKYLLHRLRRVFWPREFKKLYSMEELSQQFHIK